MTASTMDSGKIYDLAFLNCRALKFASVSAEKIAPFAVRR
jgi:hypothetical protein